MADLANCTCGPRRKLNWAVHHLGPLIGLGSGAIGHHTNPPSLRTIILGERVAILSPRA